MKSVLVLAAISAAVELAACTGPRPNQASTYASSSPSPTTSYTSPDSRQARLTPPTRPPTRKATLDALPGMSGGDLTTLLGAPQFRRRDGQAEIWQYRGIACTLDVFLYSDGNVLRVRYVDARGRDEVQAKNPAEARACAGAMIESRAAGAG